MTDIMIEDIEEALRLIKERGPTYIYHDEFSIVEFDDMGPSKITLTPKGMEIINSFTNFAKRKDIKNKIIKVFGMKVVVT